MNMHHIAMHRFTAGCLALGFLFGALGTAHADDTQWKYKSYRKSATSGYSKDAFIEGTLSVTQKDGKWLMDLTVGGNNTGPCYRTPIEAEVTRTEETTTIEPKLVAGCDLYRYVVRNDGSGGQRQVRKGEKWVNDGFDHDLKAMR